MFCYSFQREFEEAKERVREVRERAKQLLTVAKKATGTPENGELSQEIRVVRISAYTALTSFVRLFLRRTFHLQIVCIHLLHFTGSILKINPVFSGIIHITVLRTPKIETCKK